jgi:cysteine-rich repeat protein
MPLRIASLLLFSLLAFPEARAATDFWTRANKSLLLSQTRRDTPAPYTPPPTRDPILDNPAFLPLCGNGRIDTKADYYENYKTHAPLTLTKQQLLFRDTVVDNPTAPYTVEILADEECDDGNRQDLDGCSADCMHVNLWTSACEIAVDKALVYEDLTCSPARQTMVASARDGIYSLEMDPGTNAMRAQLLAPKLFAATNIFMHENSFVIYSAPMQTLWQLIDGEISIFKVRDFTTESGAMLKIYTDRAYRHEDGSFFLHDENKVLYLETLTSAATTCNCTLSRKCTLNATEGRINAYECYRFHDPWVTAYHH